MTNECTKNRYLQSQHPKLQTIKFRGKFTSSVTQYEVIGFNRSLNLRFTTQ